MNDNSDPETKWEVPLPFVALVTSAQFHTLWRVPCPEPYLLRVDSFLLHPPLKSWWATGLHEVYCRRS